MSSSGTDESFISSFITRFQAIEREIPKEAQVDGKERNFRVSFALHLLGTLLGWTREEGQGHYVVGEKYDIALYDDENFHTIIVETKSPDVDLTRADERQLRDYMEEVGSARYGVLSNWHHLILYEYGLRIGWKTIAYIDVERIIQKGILNLSSKERSQVLELRRLEKGRFVQLEDPEYFEKNYRQIPVVGEKEEGIKTLTENLGNIIFNLTDVMKRFFDTYRHRSDHHSKEFLDKAFSDWLKVSGKENDWEDENQKSQLIEDFCRETAYVIVSRTLFTRICEDKNITNTFISGNKAKSFILALSGFGKNIYMTLLDTVYDSIENYYEHFYRLGIFDWWKLTFREKDSLIEEGRRNQDDLEGELNGVVKDMLRILNRFDFANVDKDILKDVYQRYLPKDERKRLGEFYTPDEVIIYILDSVGYTSSNDIETKFLLDPACGSGSFLVQALRRLIRRYEKKGFNLKDPVIAEIVLDNIVDQIYGLDINPFACFIAEMNLLFQVVDLYELVKKKYQDYKLKRFNIYQTDSLAPPLTTEQQEKMELEIIKTTNSRAKSFIEENMKADDVKRRQFEYVVGNPPYVRKERITPEYKEGILKERFPKTYHGDNDLYVYFIDGGIKWLKNEGKLSYIVSRKFTKTRYGRNLRKQIANLCAIEEYLNLEDVRTFEDVTNYACILVLRKEPDTEKRKDQKIKVISVQALPSNELNAERELLTSIRNNISKDEYSDKFINIYESQQPIEDEEWKLIPLKAFKVFNKIKQLSDCTLNDLCNMYLGVKTSANDILALDEDTTKSLRLEKTLLKPIFEGNDIRKYKINYRNIYLIFPYLQNQHDTNEKDYSVVDIKKYPNIFQYLSQHKKTLENRYDIRKSKNEWFELRPCSYYNEFESDKIITPGMATENSFAYDKSGYYCLNSCFIITPKKILNRKNEDLLKYILGQLNSKVVNFYFKQLSTYVRGKWYMYFAEYVLPLPLKIENEYKNQIKKKVNNIIELNSEHDALLALIKKFPDSYFDLKGVKLLNVVVSFPKFSKGIYRFSKKNLQIETVRELTSEYSYSLKIAAKEYFTLRTFNEARYVQKLLRKKGRVTKSELIALVIPSKNELDKIMSRYDQDVNRLAEIEESVQKLEDEIDELVYELYGLDSEDRKVIEEYLTKF